MQPVATCLCKKDRLSYLGTYGPSVHNAMPTASSGSNTHVQPIKLLGNVWKTVAIEAREPVSTQHHDSPQPLKLKSQLTAQKCSTVAMTNQRHLAMKHPAFLDERKRLYAIPSSSCMHWRIPPLKVFTPRQICCFLHHPNCAAKVHLAVLHAQAE